MEICLDTCVFFFMLKYNDAFKNGGMAALDDTLERDRQDLEDFAEKVTLGMSKNFLKENSKLSFDEKLDSYKDYVTKKMATSLSKIEQNQNHLKGIFFDKDGNEFHMDPTPQQKETFLRKIKTFQDMFDDVAHTYDEYLKIRAAYKMKDVRYRAGLIYKASLEGEYNLNVSATACKEIYNHAGEEDSMDEDGNVTFKYDRIASLFEHCTLRTTDRKEVLDKIDKLAEEFRTKQGDETQNMAPDIDSLEIYGDSLIMAEANILGLVLITDNSKDFIKDKNIKQNNDRIRQHVSLVASQNYPYATDALAYTPRELLEGKFKVPTRTSILQMSMPEDEAGEYIESY